MKTRLFAGVGDGGVSREEIWSASENGRAHHGCYSDPPLRAGEVWVLWENKPMQRQRSELVTIFLSYPAPDQDLVENFADHLCQIGVKAWVYSIDKTLSSETWPEIETHIDEAELFAFAVSVHSRDAHGQHRELQRFIEKVQQNPGKEFRLLPIVIGCLSFSELPDVLRRVNGVRLDAHTVESTANQVALTFFSGSFR